jgi:hypothetical protein
MKALLGPFLWLGCQLACYAGWAWQAIKGFLSLRAAV